MYSINIAAELERHGIEYTPLNENEIGCVCPFHEDTSPSCHINVAKGTFICRASHCGSHGDFIAFLARKLTITRVQVTQDLSTRYNLSDEATVDAAVVEKYHTRIWSSHLLLKELYARGITDADIRLHRLGEHKGRITIPVRNRTGLFVNIRSYLPGAPGADKMKNLKGRAKVLRLFPVEQMKYKKTIICGGEMKAIATARVLNKFGYGAVCVTGGEGSWDAKLTPEFLGKDVWVMLDIDEAGITASETICKHLARTASSLAIVRLPLDIDEYPKGDVNDYIAQFVDTGKGDLLKVIEAAPQWAAEKLKRYDDDEEPHEISLTESAHAKYTQKRIKITATVSTLDTSPYVIPKDVVVECGRDQDFCSLCQVYFNDPTFTYRIHPESAAILDMVGQRKSAQSQALKDELQVPEQCRVCRFEPKTYWNVEDTRLSPQLAITSNTAERTLMPAVCIGDKLELNESYNMVGRMHPNPMTQQSTLVISKYDATQDALSSYELGDTSALERFWPSEWSVEAIQERLTDIYNDFECNVTHIYQRHNLHAMVDLAYHSPLLVQLDDKPIKGWVEVLIVGDSAQGKSETAMGLQRHYNLGEKVECKNASVAGLLGGLQSINGRWFVSWGLWPTHDRRLIIMEEVKGASQEVIGKLTDMRSSGFAEIPKIERRRTYARARAVWLSNARSNLTLDRYNYGINAITELIGSPEDVRRFDAAMLVEKSEVDSQLINRLQAERSVYPHKYGSVECRDLILWVWTRDFAAFTDEARREVVKCAQEFCDEFSDTIPLVDRGSMRYKLARLAASCAGRTFCCSEDRKQLIVLPCHVQWVAGFLRDVYNSKAMGYKEFTAAEKQFNTLSNEAAVVKRIEECPYTNDFVQHLVHTNFIDMRDLMDWLGWAPDQCNQFISFMVRNQAFKRINRHYVKTAPFIHLLRTHKFNSKPGHIEAKDF